MKQLDPRGLSTEAAYGTAHFIYRASRCQKGRSGTKSTDRHDINVPKEDFCV